MIFLAFVSALPFAAVVNETREDIPRVSVSTDSPREGTGSRSALPRQFLTRLTNVLVSARLDCNSERAALNTSNRKQIICQPNSTFLHL